MTEPPIPIVDLPRQHAQLQSELDEAIAQVVRSGQFILGPRVDEFEGEFAQYCEVGHAVGVASGTDALLLALTALGVGRGDEVITSPFTFLATASAIVRCGAHPVFVDIDPLSFNIDPECIERAITARTRAIVPVHLFGHPANMLEIMRIARANKLFVVEDCAQAVGARFDGRRVGGFGDAGCFSFYPTKNLGACGDGGAIVTSNTDIAIRVDRLRRQGATKKYEANAVGFNSRLDELQAAILSVKLRHLDTWNATRRELARRYNEGLAGAPLTRPSDYPNSYSVYHQYTVTTPHRDALQSLLRARNIQTSIVYPVALHQQAAFSSAVGRPQPSLVHSETAAREVLSLPLFAELAEAEVERVCIAVCTILQTVR